MTVRAKQTERYLRKKATPPPMAQRVAGVKRQLLSIRIHPDTLAAYRAFGDGWMTRLGADLDRAAKRLPKAKARRG